jgi:hypothetical protein
MLGDSCQHFRSNFFAVMECKYILRPTGAGENTVRSGMLPLDDPTNSEQRSENLLGLC